MFVGYNGDINGDHYNSQPLKMTIQFVDFPINGYNMINRASDINGDHYNGA